MPSDFPANKLAALAFVQQAHAGQTRAGDVPVWHHLARVSGILEQALGETGEGTPDERAAVILAGFGHDVLEDTDAAEAELAAVFGPRALAIIKGMTNTFGDDHPEPYVRQVAGAAEAVRLVKLADLADNCANVAYTLAFVGARWAEEFFLPIVRPMIDAILETDFAQYPLTAALLKSQVAVNYAVLLAETARFRDAAR